MTAPSTSLKLAYTVAGIWHSQTLFEEMGWEYPDTWDDMLDLSEQIKEETGVYPWTYQGKFPQYMNFGVLMPLVYKNGGIETIIDQDNLVEGAFSTDAVKQSLEQIQELHNRDLIMPGTEGLTHTESQAEWLQGNAVFIPSGTWLENEMREMTPDDFNMVVKPVPGTRRQHQPIPSLPGPARTSSCRSMARTRSAAWNILRCAHVQGERQVVRRERGRHHAGHRRHRRRGAEPAL